MPSINSSSEKDWPSIRDYEILSVIGSGGMGIVYKARHHTLQRTVAIKMLCGATLADPVFHHRFHTEAEAVARLQHPNIIQVFEVGSVEPLAGERYLNPFMALELVEGGTLAELTGSPQSPRHAAWIIEKLARATHAAHRLGVVHRDLKPSNVLMTLEGEPKIADFGLAKKLSAERDGGGRFVTQAGMVMGTPEYMAPEQSMGREPGPAIDIYSLGVILYELLTGRVPFQAETPEETMILVRNQEPVSPRRLQPSLPRDLETICLKCLEKAPGKRYASADELANDLARWSGGLTIRARPLGPAELTVRWARRHPAVAALSVALVLVTLTGFTGVMWKWQEAQTNAEAANHSAAEARESVRAERWERYRANIVAVSSALQVNNVSAARQALLAAPEEYRDWEWNYFHQQVDPFQDILAWAGAIVCKVAISTDGATVALLHVDDQVRVWDVAHRKVLRTFPPSRDRANMVISPDGKTLVYPGPNFTCILHDIATDRIRVVGGHKARIYAMRFSLDATRLVTLDQQGTFKVWDAVTGTQLLVGDQGLGVIRNVELSGNGKTIAGACGQEVRLWDAATGQQTAVLPGHENSIHGMRFNPQGNLIITFALYPSKVLHLWDVKTGKHLSDLRGHDNQAATVAFSPDNSLIATGGIDPIVRLWDAATGNLITKLPGHKGQVNRIAFSPDGKRLLTASQDHTVRLWDVTTSTVVAVLSEHEGEVYDAAFTTDGTHIVSGSRDGTVRSWDVQLAERNGTLRGHTNFVYGVAFHPDGEQVASASWDGTVRVWNATTGQQTLLLRHGDKTVVTSVAFHPDGRLLASIGRDDTLRLWNLRSGEQEQQWKVPTAGWRDTRVAFSPKGDLLAAGGTDGAVRLWDVNTRAEAAVLRGHRDVVRDVAFSPDGRWLASAGDADERTIRIWDVARGEQLQVLEGHTFGVYSLAFHRDGHLLASGSTDGTVRLWDTKTWTTVAVLKPGANVYGVAFSKEGTRLISACADNIIRFWDVGTYQEVAQLRGHDSYVHAISLSPDGTRLASASGDYTVRIWDILRTRPVKDNATAK